MIYNDTRRLVSNSASFWINSTVSFWIHNKINRISHRYFKHFTNIFIVSNCTQFAISPTTRVKWAVLPCWKHYQHGRHLCNNKPSNESLEGRNRKRLSSFTSRCIVAFVYFYWKQFHWSNWKTTVSPSITQIRLLHNNKSAVQHSKGTIRKLLLRIIIGWIVVLVSWFWKKIINNKQKWANLPSTTRMSLTQQPANHSEIQGHHLKALISQYNQVNWCFGIFILKEDNWDGDILLFMCHIKQKIVKRVKPFYKKLQKT